MPQTPDYSEFSDQLPPAAGDNLLARISGLARDLLTAELEVERAEEALSAAKARRQHLSEKQIPELVQEAGLMAKFTTREGLEVQIKDLIRTSVSEESMPVAVAELERRGAGRIVKHQFVIEFGKGDEAWASKFQRDLLQRKKPLAVKRKDHVHPQTLQAYLREELEAGAEIPYEKFGAQKVSVAKVRLPAAEKLR